MRTPEDILRLFEALDRPWLPGERVAAVSLIVFAELWGYGNAMQLLSEVWRRDDPLGALTVGPCAADVTEEAPHEEVP